MIIETRPSVKADIYSFYSNLQEKDRQEVEKLGFTPRKALYIAYRKGIHKMTGLVDNEIVAMWGLTFDSLLSNVGHPYFLSGPNIRKIETRLILSLYKEEIREMLTYFPVLENYVDESYTEAIRLLKLAKFTIFDPQPMGKNKEMFCQFRITRDDLDGC
jgi:hypothetical protein